MKRSVSHPQDKWQEESSFCEQKEAKKLYPFLAVSPNHIPPSRKSFFASFFPKKEVLAFTCLLLTTQAQAAGDPARGQAIAASRAATCVLCHPAAAPGPQATIAPDLRGIGARLTEAQLRQRLTDPAALNPQTIMPSFSRTEGLQRVGAPWRGKPILNDAQIEDVVAWLMTLKTP